MEVINNIMILEFYSSTSSKRAEIYSRSHAPLRPIILRLSRTMAVCSHRAAKYPVWLAL